jgi:outer membrane protein assembly factor BamB
MDKSKGNQLWISEIDEIYAKPVLIGQVIYVKGASTHTVYAISPDDGRIIGKLQLEIVSFGMQMHSKYVQGVQSLGKYLLITTSDTVFAYGSDL